MVATGADWRNSRRHGPSLNLHIHLENVDGVDTVDPFTSGRSFD